MRDRARAVRKRGDGLVIASGVLMIIVGVWIVLQTLVGDLPGRILSWAGIR